jgi:inhibitor of KinA sporulation pathway (predicted exonuclease)
MATAPSHHQQQQPPVPVAPPTAPTPPPFDFYVVLDFEAAFNKPSGYDKVMEIIELPSVLVDARPETGFAIRSEFQRYARPVIHPQMHPEVTALTGITQATVDKANTFPRVFQEYRRWLLESGLSAIPPAPPKPARPALSPNAGREDRKQAAVDAALPPQPPFVPHARSRSFCFVTCGDWDIKTMLPTQFREGGTRAGSPSCSGRSPTCPK